MLRFKQFIQEKEQLPDPRAKNDNKEKLPMVQNKTGGPNSLTLPSSPSTNIPTNPGTQWNPNYKNLDPNSVPPTSSKINSEGGRKRK